MNDGKVPIAHEDMDEFYRAYEEATKNQWVCFNFQGHAIDTQLASITISTCLELPNIELKVTLH